MDIHQMRKALLNKENIDTHSYEDKRYSELQRSSGYGSPSKRNSSQLSESHYQYSGVEKKIKVFKRDCKKSDPEEQHKRYVSKVRQNFGGTASPIRN